MKCITSNRGKNLISKLNINIAVSNFQQKNQRFKCSKV